MFSRFWAIIEIIRAIIRLINEFAAWRERVRKDEARKRLEQLEKALEDAKKAETDEEIWDAQERIIDNSKP